MKILFYITITTMIIYFTNQNLEAECETMENFNQRYSEELENQDFAYFFDELDQAGGTYGDVAKIQFKNINFVAKRVDLPETDNDTTMQYKEIKILKDLKGKNHLLQYISCVIDKRENEDLLYILTETLYDDLDNYENFDTLKQKKKISLYIDILEGLKELHSVGYVHNDIKPPNVMSTDSSFESVKLIDFGFTTKIGEQSRGGSRFYLPFEKVLHGSIASEPEGDLVAFGVSIGIMEFGYNTSEKFIGSSLSDTKAKVWEKYHEQIADAVGHRYPKERVKKNFFFRFIDWVYSLFVKDTKNDVRNMKDLLVNIMDNNMKNILDIDDVIDIMKELRTVHDVEDKEMEESNRYVPDIKEEDVHGQEVYEFLFKKKVVPEDDEDAAAEKAIREIII